MGSVNNGPAAENVNTVTHRYAPQHLAPARRASAQPSKNNHDKFRMPRADETAKEKSGGGSRAVPGNYSCVIPRFALLGKQIESQNTASETLKPATTIARKAFQKAECNQVTNGFIK